MKKLLSLILVGILMFSGINAFSEENKINIDEKINGNTVNLNHSPFIKNDIIYLPLRELFEKTGVIDYKNSYVNWDNGKIEILAIEKSENRPLAYHYGLEIGKKEYTLNPGKEEIYKQKWNISNKKEMKDAPVLINNTTYVPFEYVEYLINKSMQYTKIEIINAE